jgi:hypothetical protein
VRREPRFPGALPSAWQVPARNPNFTGRSGELEDLARAVAGSSRVTVESLRGWAGSRRPS